MVEQEQIQKRTFTNWVNAQLAKRRPPCMVVDLFNDFRDGSKLLDLLEVMSNQCISRERGRGTFQHRSNIEKALAFLRQKSIKLVNINIPDIIDGKPSIILGLIWTIILQYHIEELASALSFNSRQSSMESLASLDSRCTSSSRSVSSSPVPHRGSPLHARFKVSAKKALLLWVREQCHKAGCSVNVKDFKGSWRSGVVFLAILYALKSDLVDLSKASTRSNKQNLEEAFCVAERELRIPRLLEPDDVDVRDPDEKSIMTYVAQFLQYSRDLPVPEEDMQATPDRKAQEVSCWLLQAYDELLEGWESTEGESYSERYHVFQTFLVSFNEQRRPIMPLLTAMRRSANISEDQRALREAWDALTEKLHDYKIELDVKLPAPLDLVARWLMRTEAVLAEEEGDPQDHGRAADEAKEKQGQLKVCLEEMPHQVKTFQAFQNQDEYGNMLVPTEKMEELKRRFTGIRVTAKYHGIKLEYREDRHTVLDLLGQIRTKVCLWKRAYISPEALRVLLQEWHDLVNAQELPSMLEAALRKLKLVAEKYASKSALAADYHHVCQQVTQLEGDTAAVLVEVFSTKSTMAQMLTAWDSYSDGISSMQAWLEQSLAGQSYDSRPKMTSESLAEWGSRRAHLNEVANFLMESIDPQSRSSLAEELHKLNVNWDKFIQRNTSDSADESDVDIKTRPQDLQALVRDASLLLKEPLETMAGPLRIYRKRIQFLLRKIKEVDLEALDSSSDAPADQIQKLKMAMPEAKQTLCEAEQVCAELQHSVSGLDSRLAELLHWETEARDLYQLLRATERQQQRGQDPRARVLISRGLQLEGQVVTEDQDLQVLIMKHQKSSPIQYLHDSTMQGRVQAAVSQSQDAVGMLSSLGARRDRSRSPTRGPPSKVFIKAKTKPHHLRQSDTGPPTQDCTTLSELYPSQEVFVPKIVVQEYREEKINLPTLSYNTAQAAMQTSPPPTGVQTQAWTGMMEQQQTNDDTLIRQQHPKRPTPQELEHHQLQIKVQEKKGIMRKETQGHKDQQLDTIKEYIVEQYVVTPVKVETKVLQTTSVQELMSPEKKPLNSQELQTKKAQALKNRPWLQKPLQYDIESPNKVSAQEPVQATQPQTNEGIMGFTGVTQRHTVSPRTHAETKDDSAVQSKKQKEQLIEQGQNQQMTIVAAQPDEDTRNKSKTPDLPLQQGKVKSHPPAEMRTQSQVQLQPPAHGHVLTQGPTWAQVRPSSPVQVPPLQGKIEPPVPSHIQLRSHPQSWSPVRPPSPKLPAQIQSHAQEIAHSQKHPLSTQAENQAMLQIQSHSYPETQTKISAVQPQTSPVASTQTDPMSQTVAQSQATPQPMVKIQQNAQPKTMPENQAQNIQHQTHSQSKSQTQATSHSMSQPQISPGSMTHEQTKSQARTQPQKYAEPVVQTHPILKAQSQKHVYSATQSHTKTETVPQIQTPTQPKTELFIPTHAQSMVQSQTPAHSKPQPSLTQPFKQYHPQGQPVVQPEGHPLTQYHAMSQSAVQHQEHIAPGHIAAWNHDSSSSSMTMKHPQAPVQPQVYPQNYSLAQQWAASQEPQNKDIVQQRHHISQPYTQQIGQAPQSQAPQTAQWAQGGHPQRPQMGSTVYSDMVQSYNQSQMQIHAHSQLRTQTISQIRPESQQQPQMQAYDVTPMQTQQGHSQQQMWKQVPHHFQSHPSYPQAQQHQLAEHPFQSPPNIRAQMPQLHHTGLQYPPQPYLQPFAQAQSQPHIQTHSQAHMQPKIYLAQQNPSLQQLPPQFRPMAQTPNQPQAQPLSQYIPEPHPTPIPKMSSTQPMVHSLPQYMPEPQLAPHPSVQSSPQPKAQSLLIYKPELQQVHQLKAQPSTQTKAQSLLLYKPELQIAAHLKDQPPTQGPKVPKPPQYIPQPQPAPQPKVQPSTQTKDHSFPHYIAEPQPARQPNFASTQTKAQSPPQCIPESQLAPQPKDLSPTVGSVKSLSRPSPEVQSPQLKFEPPGPVPESQLQSQTTVPIHLQSQPQPQILPAPQYKQKTPQVILHSQVCVLPHSQAESPDICFTPPVLAQAPPQAYSEAYAKAQALARNGFEEAKHCLQGHILEAISIFKDKYIADKQASVTETLKTLDPELLDEFLRAAKGMEAFCTPSQLKDMEVFTQSVRSQWESCFSAKGSFADEGHQLDALKELCDMLSPEDAHRLAHTQLKECESSLAAIQRQFSGDQEASLPDSRTPVVFSADQTPQKETASDKPQVSSEVSPMKIKTATVEQKDVTKQPPAGEDVIKKEALERYDNCKKSLQAQLSKNEQSIKDVPSDSVTLKALHTRLQEIQFLRQETESLWSEFANQCFQLRGDIGMEQEKSELEDQWRAQQSNLQRRGSSLGAALRQIDSTENHMVDFSDRLDRYLRHPKNITAFTLANTNILKDIKELDENIQSELDQLSRLEPESSNLDPRDCLTLSREVESHRSSLDQLRQQVRKSEAAARALDRFLMSLRTLEEDIGGVQGAPCSGTAIWQDSRAKLALIRQSVDSLKDKAPQLDLLLQGARLTVTRDGSPASCLDMVSVLVKKLDEADSGLVVQHQSHKRETQSKSLGLKKRTLLGEVRKLQETIETRGLNEATVPAVQQRLRALSDLEETLQTQKLELQSLRELPECQREGQNLLEELNTEYKQTETSLTDRKQQCSILLELLKKFQSCRSQLSNTLQRAEQAIGEQTSYMGRDNLQRIITKVQDIKKELSGLSEQMDEIRGVCRQLQTTLKKFPDCREVPFEAEADTLMDSWLDMTEKTDTYIDNLQVGLELWDKQLMLGGEIDGWAAKKLAVFAESHPFYNQQQVMDMKDEIQAHEENIQHFHRKSEEIQEMLQSQDSPLELQVMETQLRKRMEQVKELFADCTDVFEELMVVKKHLEEKIEEYLSAIGIIQCSVSKVQASEPKMETQIQDLCDNLEHQEEQAESVLREIALVTSMASPQVLETLSADCGRLTDAIAHTKDMIHQKREERDKGLLKIFEDQRQSFEDWFQDLQLAVNECFENPECQSDVETSLQRLTSSLKSNDAEQRLDQLRDYLDRGHQQIDAQQLTELSNWLKEQREEVLTFNSHCLNRQKQMESLHSDLSRLQTLHDSFHEWLHGKEKQNTTPAEAKHLLMEVRDESQRADALIELLAAVRRQGVRADRLLKDGDDVLQRYRKLEARLHTQTEAHSILQAELEQFIVQAESTRIWFKDLMQPLMLADGILLCKEMMHKAEAVLSTKPEGDSKVNQLRCQGHSLCEQEELEQSRKQGVQQSVRDMENEWQAVLQAAEDALNKAKTQARLDREVDAFKVQSDSLQSWISNLDETLQSSGDCADKRPHDVLLIKPDVESKLQQLKGCGQSLCNNVNLDEGLRQEVQDTIGRAEEQWRMVMIAAEEVETAAATNRDIGALQSRIESTQSWIWELRHRLLSLGSHMTLQERLQVTQAVMASQHEGQSKVLDLKKEEELLWDKLDESRRLEVARLVNDVEQQWRSVLQTCKEAELRGFADDFETQSKNTQSWLREQERQLLSVSVHAPPEEKRRIAQGLLQSKPDGDCQVNNLRRRGQSLCDRQDAEESKKDQVQQMVRDTEEQWRKVLQAARKLEEDAGVQIKQEMERRELELAGFKTHHQETTSWLSDLQHQLDSLTSQATAQSRQDTAQTIVGCKSKGDGKIQEMKRRCQNLYADKLEQHQKLDLQQMVQDAEDQWTRILQSAKVSLDVAEKQSTLQCQLRKYKEAREEVQAWLEEKRQNLHSLNCHKDPEVAISIAQAILSSKPNTDCQLAELRRQSRSVYDHDGEEDTASWESEQAVINLEEQWRTLLHDAENSLKKAEVLYSLSRELQAFFSQAASTDTWLEELQTELETTGPGTHGSQVQIEERLNTAQIILNSKSSGENRVMELQRRMQSLCEHKDLEEDSRLEVQTQLKKVEEQWKTIMQAADERSRLLQGVMDLLVSCRYQRGQAEARLVELQAQMSTLPRIFPWPGLGERRQAVEQAQALLDKRAALGPLLSDLHTQAAELCQTTRDPDWADPTLGGMEESILFLLKELNEALMDLEQGIMAERQCTQLVEQHEAAQDWLREQVKALLAPSDDRQGLHSAINTLKALLQTVNREKREMRELDAARDDLLNFCTPGGRDALTLEVNHLHELCATSEMDVRERLQACEARLQDLERQAAQKTKELMERAADLQWELQSLDQALAYSELQDNIEQLQQYWHSLQNCEKSLEELCVKVEQLHQDVKSADQTSTEITTTVDSLRQQHDSLQTRLREHQESCSTNAARSLINSLQALQEWNHSKPLESTVSVQETVEEGEKIQAVLREALSHQQFLNDCLKQDIFNKLLNDSSETLRLAGTLHVSLCHKLKDLMEKSDPKPEGQSIDVDNYCEEKKTSLVVPPRKNKQSTDKRSNFEFQQNIPLTDTSTLNRDDLSVLLRSTEQTENTVSEETKDIPTKRKSKTQDAPLAPLPTGEIVDVEKKTEHESINTLDRGKDEAVVMEESKLLPPKRKAKPAETADINEVAQEKEGNGGLHGATTLGPVYASSTEASKSKQHSKSWEPSVSIEECTRISDAVVLEAKITPPKRKSKSSPELPLNEEPTVEPKEGKLIDNIELNISDDSNVHDERKNSESGKGSVVQLVTEIFEDTMKDIALPLAEDALQLESRTPSQVVTEIPKVIVEEGKIAPPKRKSKKSKISPELPKKEEHILTKEEYHLEPKEEQLFKDKGLSACDNSGDDSNLQKARKDSENGEASAVEQLVTGIIEAAMKDFGLPSKKDQLELESRKTSQIVTEIPEVFIAEEGGIALPKIKLKTSNISPELPKGDEQILTKEEFHLEHKEERLPEDKELSACENSGDDSNLQKVRKESENGEASVVSQLVTGIIAAAMKDAGLTSKKNQIELESREYPSGSVVTGIPEVVEEGKILPPKRKSKDMKFSPKLPSKEVTVSTASSGFLKKTKEDPDSQRLCFFTGLSETTVFEECKLKEEAEIEQKSSTENSVEEVQDVLPTERKSKSPDVSTKSAVDKENDLRPKDGQQHAEAVVGARLSEDAVIESMSPPKRKPKSGKVSSETPKMPTRRKSKNHDVPRVSTEPVIVISDGFEPSTEKSRQSLFEQLVKSQSDAAVLEDITLSPTKRKTKSFQIHPELEKGEDESVTNVKQPKEDKEQDVEDVQTQVSTHDMHDVIKSLPEESVGLEDKSNDMAMPDVQPKTKCDETTPGIHENTAESHVTKLAVLAHKDETFTKITLAEQTMTPMQTLIELELLETTRVQPEEVKDDNVQVQVCNNDATISLEKTSVLLQRVPDRAGLDTFEVNIQSQVEDGQVMRSAEQQVLKTESGQSSSVIFRTPEPNKTELIEIILCEQVVEKTCQTDTQVEPLETSQESSTEAVEQTAAISTSCMQDKAMTIHIGPKVHLLKVDITACQEEQKNSLETGPTKEIVQCIQGERPQGNKNLQDIVVEELPERQKTVIDSHSAQLFSDFSAEKASEAETKLLTTTEGRTKDVHAQVYSGTEGEKASKDKADDTEKDKTTTEMTEEKKEISTEILDNVPQSEGVRPISVAFEPTQPLESGSEKKAIQSIQNNDQSQLCGKSLGQEEIQITATQEKESRQEPSVQYDRKTVNKSEAASGIQPIRSAIKMTETEVSEFADPPLHPDPDTVSETETAQQKNSTTKEEADNLISSTRQKEPGKVVTQTDTTTSTSEQMVAEEASSYKFDHDGPETSQMMDIFSAIRMTTDARLLNEAAVCEDSLEELMTSSSDLDDRWCRLVSKLLSCKNHPSELQPTVMIQQVKEAQECKDMAQQQVVLLGQQREADAESSDTLRFMEQQWSAAARDAAVFVQNKVFHLQLVQSFCEQTQEAKTTLERLATDLDAVGISLAEGSHKEADRLNSVKRDIEKNRSALGKLDEILTKLYPLLSRFHQATAKSQLQTLHQEWRDLDRVVKKALHHTDVQYQNASSLLLELSYLRGHLESISEELEAKHPQVCQWDYKKAQQLMMAHAEVNAAHVKYHDLKERSQALLPTLWPKETAEIKKGLLNVKDQLCLTEEWISSQIQKSTNPIMEKVMTVAKDGLSWAKQMESDIESRQKRVSLHPEAVHQQLRDLKKLQSEVAVKQSQLKSQANEITRHLPQLDPAEEVPVVHSLLESLEELSKSITEKLCKAMKDTESGLQVREKLSEQIADIDTWVGTHLQRETTKSIGGNVMSYAEIDHNEIKETLVEAEKQSAACKALLVKSKDIASELSIRETSQLFDKLTNLQEEIFKISSYETFNKNELDEHVQSLESNKQQLAMIEKNLNQMQDDLDKLRFPVTSESLQLLEAFKQMLLEHKSQIDTIHSWIPEEKTMELYSITAEIHDKMTSLQMKARDHERYLNMRQCVEDLKEAVEKQVNQTGEDREVVEKYKICQKLLFQFPLIKRLCDQVGCKLQTILTDPLQLSSEQRRLKRNEESFNILEMKTLNNLSLIEWCLVKEVDLDLERKATHAFLWETHHELQKPPQMEPNERSVNEEYQKVLFLKKTVESRMRALDVREQNKENKEGTSSSYPEDLKNEVLSECDSQMENISDARISLRNYTCTVKQTLKFLRDTEISLLPLMGSNGFCRGKLEDTQMILASLQENFQTYIDQLKGEAPLHPYLSPVEAKTLQEAILSQFLVRMSTLKAKGKLHLENLTSCAEAYRNYTKCIDDISLSMKNTQQSLAQVVSQKVNSLTDCSDQLARVVALQEEVDCLQKHLEEMVEWCPEPSCRGLWESSMVATWRCLGRLKHCSQQLTARLKQRIAELSDITCSVEKASALLQQMEAELPEPAPLIASTNELHDLLQSWEQYQDRLDCEHRSLSALELRIARLLGVPANVEQAPPIPLCQQLQAMQAKYNSVKQRSLKGLESIKLDLEDKQKVQEELQVVWVWLTAAGSLLSEIDPSSNKAQLKEIHNQLYIQKALVHRITESLKTKYLEVVPVEIASQLQEIQKNLQQVEAKVEEAIEKSGLVNIIGAKLLETHAGLMSVQVMLEEKSSTVKDAKLTQKLVWDELDQWHSCVAALEADILDLEHPQEALSLAERLMELQQLHARLAKQAEQKTTILSKMQTWLQEHQEMINSSRSWMAEAKLWLATPRTYTTAKCLSDHVHHLQTVLSDSAQIRTALQDFSSVLAEMSQVVDISALREELIQADSQVASLEDSFGAPLSQLEHTAAEVDMIESEVSKMEKNIAEIKNILSSPEALPSPKEKPLKMVEQRIQTMRSSIADIQRAKLELHLPEKAAETLSVFSVIDQLQMLLLELEKKVPALFIQQLPTQVLKTPSQAGPLTSSPKEDAEQGRITIARVEDDVLQRSGAALMRVERATPEQRRLETTESPMEPPEKSEASSEESAERESLVDTQDVCGATDQSSYEDLSELQDTDVRSQNLPGSMVNTSSTTVNVPKAQQRCVLS